MSQLRDAFGQLFEHLIESEEGPLDLDDGDHRASVRLLSNTLLNFTSVAGADGLERLEGALPWLGALATWYRRRDDSEAPATAAAELAEYVRDAGGGLALGTDAIERRLRRRLERRDGAREGLVEGLARAARDDRALRRCGACSDTALVGEALDRTELLELVVEVVGHGTPAGFANRFVTVFPFGGDAYDTSIRDLRGRLRSLRMLRALERGTVEALAEEGGCDRSCRDFELGLARHMGRTGVARAVRAALAFGPGTMNEAGGAPQVPDVGSWFQSVSAQKEGLRGWAGLADALAENRWRFVRCLAVEVPRAHLREWRGFLEHDCREFAERTEVSYRETVHYAHYCMHLMNVCDLMVVTEGALDADVRDALLEIEHALKESVLDAEAMDAGAIEAAVRSSTRLESTDEITVA